MMTLKILAQLIDEALGDPPDCLLQLAEEHYQPYYHFMYLLAPYIQKGIFLELGVNRGLAINSFAKGNPAAHAVGLDLNVYPDYTEDNVEFHLLSALPVPEFLQNKNIKALHIDTEHSYDNATNEFRQYQEYLLPGAVIMFDDLHAMNDGVLAAFMDLEFPKIQCDKLHPINGYGVVLYEE